MTSFIHTKVKDLKIYQYSVLLKMMQQKIEESTKGNVDHPKIDKIRLNYQRYLRIHKTYQISKALRNMIDNISVPQDWYILTEDWCGDSGQILPYLEKFSRINPHIRLKLLSREENRDIMDYYVTDGKRSIPKVIAVNENGEELFRWGPRPAEAQRIFDQHLQGGLSKPQAMEQLHGWYAKNRGKAIESEFVEIFQRLK